MLVILNSLEVRQQKMAVAQENLDEDFQEKYYS